MKPLLLIYLTLFLLGSQATFITSPEGPLETYKAYVRGTCIAVGADCDLTTFSSCWDDTSSMIALRMIYQAAKDVADATPHESYTKLRTFFTEGHARYIAPIANQLECQANLPFSRTYFEKIGMKGQTFNDLLANILRYASARPEPCFIALKQMAVLGEQGNFEAVGLLDGNFMSQAASVKREGEGPYWRKNAKESRALVLKGMCESLGLECPTESLNYMNEEASAADLNCGYEWAKTVATSPITNAPNVNTEFLLGRGKQLFDRISRSEVERDSSSAELKLINEKLGFDVWGAEFYEAMVEFPKEFPELSWYYKRAEYLLMEKDDLEGVGMVLGLDWYQIAEWKKGRLTRGTLPMIDL